MPGRRIAVALALTLAFLLAACTQDPPAARPAPSASRTRGAAVASVPAATPTLQQPGTVIQGKAPRFRSTPERDTAFVAALAALDWPAKTGPGHPARFRRPAVDYALGVCADARRLRSAGRVQAPAVGLASLDQAELIRLSVLFYCPQFSASGRPSASDRPEAATCPTPKDIVVTSELTSGAVMTDNEFYSTVSYVVAYMNLTDYPVWVTPQIKWRSRPIFKGGYPTGDLNRPQGWRPFTDPHEEPTTPGRRLAPGEVWRVDALQNGPYVWTGMSARIDPTAFVPQGCGYVGH